MSDNVPKTVIEGDYTDAVVFLPGEEIEEGLQDQIETMVNHPAIDGKVRIQPDSHVGAGAVIGFTMPLHNKVVPNVVGVDQGCGMEAIKLETPDSFDPTDENDLLEANEAIRDLIPVGREAHDYEDDNYHMRDDFPWDEFRQKWSNFAQNHLDDDIELGEYHPDTFDPGAEYFEELCEKVEYSTRRAVNSVGSLGGGNHFIELGIGKQDNKTWAIIHSGSRGLGKAIAEYHQEQAQKIRSIDEAKKVLRNLPEGYLDFVKFDLDSVGGKELLDWLQGGMGESFVDYEALKKNYGEDNPEKIEAIGNVLKEAIPDNWGSDDLAYLEGEEAVEYYVDLAFGQTYALENRRQMVELVAEALNAEIKDQITAVHNYIDYEDGIIRKGATPARKGQRVVIPMNMSDGTFIAEGKGNDEWNQSVAHGAGRVMSRTKAFDVLSEEEHAERMGGTIATELPLDEAPMAYKDMSLLKEMIEPTVDIINHVEPLLNIKAPE